MRRTRKYSTFATTHQTDVTSYSNEVSHMQPVPIPLLEAVRLAKKVRASRVLSPSMSRIDRDDKMVVMMVQEPLASARAGWPGKTIKL